MKDKTILLYNVHKCRALGTVSVEMPNGDWIRYNVKPEYWRTIHGEL